MKHDPLNLSERTKKVLNQLTVLLFHGGLSLAIIADILIDRQYYNTSTLIGISAVCVFFLLYGIARFFDLFKVNNYPLAYLIVYHIIFIVGFGLFAPEYSPFLFTWLILLYITNYYYGRPGFLLSSGLLLATLTGAAFRLFSGDVLIYDYIQSVLTQGGVLIVLGLFFLETESVADKDQKLLIGSIDKAEVETQRLTALINSMGDGVISTDENGVIKLYNAAALNVLDTNTSLDNKNIGEIMKLIDKSAKMVDLAELATSATTNIISDEYLMVYPDGEKINLYLNISPIKLSFQQNIERGFIISFRDITREKSLEEERNEFISVVSHELRTPIAIAEANVSNAQFIVEKGNNIEGMKVALDATHKQVLFLANMINDLSTLSRAERGTLDMTVEEISPREIMQSLVDDYKKEADTKGLEFSIEIEDSTPDKVMSNRLYIREILQNFVTNAIKYTKEGGVKVVSKADDDGVIFEVKDTGIGISKSDQKRVFDKFFRSEDFRTRESSGTGLGLYVAKKLMKLINASIDLKSKLNEGSTFSVHVPNQVDKTKKDHDIEKEKSEK